MMCVTLLNVMSVRQGNGLLKCAVAELLPLLRLYVHLGQKAVTV